MQEFVDIEAEDAIEVSITTDPSLGTVYRCALIHMHTSTCCPCDARLPVMIWILYPELTYMNSLLIPASMCLCGE